ncbi:glycerophosphoryl diester phosphodiesterase [Stanieria cyanosphaera PCC 7437]|uniref:glycerophosphodiester phosphodiesterase n=1 Tax=Stanieria cyanosphaera (strain ATCC 29371 / PCC 7437) TaxID=111780 RepID=K9XMB0_STAC7|nr:glycerophosphodiester phosphodiesterase [Stanieria cyanosphaera]AFZ33740.1 glycerophosphoryl diester phosphodiesterase [Stanieria cyanosphaera PCC 7437]
MNKFSYSKPIIIAHRGASGLRPEHTLAAYQLAIEQGADFIEPDLVPTKDGILVARHENALAILHSDGSINRTNTTTDVFKYPQFQNRLTTKIIDGQTITGWFTEDFTLAELKTINAIQRLPELRGTEYDDHQLKIPTLVEIINLVQQVEQATGKKIGIYPETKHPTYFAEEGKKIDGTLINLSIERLLIDTLTAQNFTNPEQIFIQSFEVNNLRALKYSIMPEAGVDLPLIQLINSTGLPYDQQISDNNLTYQDLITPQGLTQIVNYAVGIGVAKNLIMSVDQHNNLLSPTSLIKDAHQAGLLVHAYTLRNENIFLANDYQNKPELEYQQLIELGIDGFFTDFPATAKTVTNY